jgi:hypothetical protein
MEGNMDPKPDLVRLKILGINQGSWAEDLAMAGSGDVLLLVTVLRIAVCEGPGEKLPA